ncbi:MAG: sterol desaturase family protein, partial [Bacteroidota bacterium]
IHGWRFVVDYRYEWQDLIQDQMQALTFRQRLGYLFGPPGYSHDGSRKTSDQLREEMNSLQS